MGLHTETWDWCLWCKQACTENNKGSKQHHKQTAARARISPNREKRALLFLVAGNRQKIMTNKTWYGHTRTHAKLFHRFTSSGTKTAVTVSYCVWRPCLDSAVFSCRLRLTNTWKRIHSVPTADSRCTAKRRRGLTAHKLKCPCQFGEGGSQLSVLFWYTGEAGVDIRVWQGEHWILTKTETPESWPQHSHHHKRLRSLKWIIRI